VQDPAACEIYTEHSQPTTMARYSPSTFYMASGDQMGKIRIWDTTQKTHILKSEYPVLSGPIRDITWSPDSKRVAVVGEGKDRRVLMEKGVTLADSATSSSSTRARPTAVSRGSPSR